MIPSGKIIIWSGMLTIFCGKLIICRGKITKIVLDFNIDFPLTCSFDLVTFFHDVVWFCRKRSETFYFERQDISQWECSSGSTHSPTHLYNNQRSLLCWYVFLYSNTELQWNLICHYGITCINLVSLWNILKIRRMTLTLHEAWICWDVWCNCVLLYLS